jgi:hypothetical protein
VIGILQENILIGGYFGHVQRGVSAGDEKPKQMIDHARLPFAAGAASDRTADLPLAADGAFRESVVCPRR